MLNLPSYVLITPARNEAEFIELTIQSVVSQTVKPVKWFVVSDGSTDGTDDIVRKYAAGHSWIELISAPERRERNFAGKVHAFNAGYARARELNYEVIGCLDADISFPEDYLHFLLERFTDDASLGVAGTSFVENSGKAYDYRFTNIEHVSGGCQLFRRQCFEDIGGYVPVKGGSIDHIAVLTARMKGWKTQSFPEKSFVHHRPMGTAGQSALHAKFKLGAKDYAVGNHPLWELFRMVYQITSKPFVIGSLALGTGYAWQTIRQAARPASPELVAFQRREQMLRLKRFLTGYKDPRVYRAPKHV